jgi:cell envelope opacity-associated protein A
MNPKRADLFVSDAGTEVSVRTSRNISTGALMIEPLYATDIELLDGATGELQAEGVTLRGTLRRTGNSFVLDSEQSRTPVRPKKRPKAPSAVPVVPIAAARPTDPESQVTTSAASDAEALAAADTLRRFVRGERGVPLKAARRAYELIGGFIAERERRARART